MDIGSPPTSSNQETRAKDRVPAKITASEGQFSIPMTPIAVQPKATIPTTAMPPPCGIGRI